MRRSVSAALACLLLGMSLAWAQDGAGQPNEQQAAVRVAYLVAEGAPVHVRVRGVTVVSPVRATSVSGYHLVGSGQQEVTVLDASENAGESLGPASAPVIGRDSRAFEPGGYYTVVVTERAAKDSNGESGSEPLAATVDVRVFHDSLPSFAGAGEARIRMLNLHPSERSWSVFGAPGRDDRARAGGMQSSEVQIADAVPYAEATPWVGVPMGIYTFRFESGGGSLPAPLEVALYGGTLYTAFLYPGPSDEAPRVVIFADAVVRGAAGPAPARPGGPP